MLLGQYDYSIDPKGRLNFPAKFREDMGDSFIVTRWLDDCLVAFPKEEFQQMAQLLMSKGITKNRDVQRFLFAAATEVEPDKQGRILLPAKLREHAGLDKEVTIIGNMNHAEIWNTQAWNQRQEAMDTESIAQAIDALDF